MIVNSALLPYQFNPPPHPSILPVMPFLSIEKRGSPENADADSVILQESMADYFDEGGPNYSAEAADRGKDFQTLRLGRICMAEAGMTYALQEKGYRYGFRFMFNPATMAGGQSVGANWIPDPSNTITAILQDGLETLSFELLLNRMPEVQGDAKGTDYPVPVSDEEMYNLRTRGTHYDLEYLYRCCNGLHNTTYRQGTGDIGILLPNPLFFFLGPFKSRGALRSISAVDRLFSLDMVPMLTYVNIQFDRYFTMATGESTTDRFAHRSTSAFVQMTDVVGNTDFNSILMGAVSRAGSGGGSSGGSGGGSSGPAPSGGSGPTPSGGSGWTLAPSLKKLGDDAKAKYSQVGIIGTYRNQNGSGHQKVGSGSESKGTVGSVHALDIMINVSTQSMTLLNKLVAKSKAGDQRLWYLIHDRKIWSKNHGWEARPYTGSGTAHTDHIHVSLNGDTTSIGVKNENDLSDWGI